MAKKKTTTSAGKRAISDDKRRKDPEDRKEYVLRVRLTDAQREELTRAAEKATIDLSSWVRSVALERARELEKK